MATPSLVQSCKATSVAANTTISKAFGSNVTAGNRIFVYACSSSGSANTLNVPTGGSITFTLLASNTVATTAVILSVYTGVVVTTGALTITQTQTGSHELGFTAQEWSNCSAQSGSGCLDVSATGGSNNNVTTDCASGTTAATHNATELAITVVGDWGAVTPATWTLGTANGFVKDANASVDADPNIAIAVATQIISSSGVTAGGATWTSGGSIDSDAALVVVIKPLFTQALAGGLSFAGSQKRATATKRTAALGFTGAHVKGTSTKRTAVLSFAGAHTKTAGKSFTAAVGFVGAVARRTLRPVSAQLGFTGAQTKATTRGLMAALGFTGSVGRGFVKTLTGGLSFAGGVARATSRAFSASLPFSGTTNKAVQRTLSAALGFVGATTKRTARSLTATLGLSGVVSTGRFFFQNLTAALSFTGSQQKSTQRPLGGSLSLSGSQSKATAHGLDPAALTFAGSTSKGLGRGLTAALSFVGGVTKNTGKAVAAALAFVGVLGSVFQGVVAQVLNIINPPVSGTVAAVMVVQLPGGTAIFYLLSYVPDEVPIGEVATFKVQLAGSDGTRPTPDLAPVMRVLDSSGTAVTPNTTMTAASGIWSATWTPSTAGAYSIEVRTAYLSNNLAAQIPVTVRPRFDPIALATGDVLVSRM